MAVHLLHQNLKSVHRTRSFISRRVSLRYFDIYFTNLWLITLLAEEANRMYSRVLRSELFGNTVPQADLDQLSPDPFLGLSNGINEKTRAHTPPSHVVSNLPPASITPSTPHKNLFNYASPRGSGQPTPSKTPRSQHGPNLNVRSELYSLSPIRYDSQRILETPRKQPRYVNKVPYKVLDAPDLQDDFYLNLVDWGSSNVLGVGLGNSVYMWNSQTGRVTKLCELRDDSVTSVNWIQRVSCKITSLSEHGD
jgi:cell division cycle 20-like protein 1 (cofactor of APC complex)